MLAGGPDAVLPDVLPDVLVGVLPDVLVGVLVRESDSAAGVLPLKKWM